MSMIRCKEIVEKGRERKINSVAVVNIKRFDKNRRPWKYLKNFAFRIMFF